MLSESGILGRTRGSSIESEGVARHGAGDGGARCRTCTDDHDGPQQTYGWYLMTTSAEQMTVIGWDARESRADVRGAHHAEIRPRTIYFVKSGSDLNASPVLTTLTTTTSGLPPPAPSASSMAGKEDRHPEGPLGRRQVPHGQSMSS